MGVKDKLKNTWTTIKTNLDETLTFKANDPENTQNRASPLNKDFYTKPYFKKNKKK